MALDDDEQVTAVARAATAAVSVSVSKMAKTVEKRTSPSKTASGAGSPGNDSNASSASTASATTQLLRPLANETVAEALTNLLKKLTTEEKKCLVLKSPMGASPMVYQWPLKKGKGSMRRSEDKHDEAAEIIETIRWVCEDVPAIRAAMEGSNYLTCYDNASYETMTAICERYNKAVENYVNSENASKKESRVSRPHLKHILTKCYNRSVIDPNELNHYEAFTPEVYGETSFELICQILDRLQPIGEENRFVDLGSGVGQVVLQVAALTECSLSLGIEKANTPANYAMDLEKWFKFWMAFYGKMYWPFKLVHGDFLDKKHRPEILESTIVFVNNFAFGPEVDQHLKDIFADLNDGTRIFSSKSFCALNFRITDRNLSDIGTIMHVSKMDPLKGSVSWTGKPVSYFLHIMDRGKLMRYFQRNAAARKADKDEEASHSRRNRKSRRDANASTNASSSNMSSFANSNDNSLLDQSAASGAAGTGELGSEETSRNTSRASSAEKDEGQCAVTTRRQWQQLTKPGHPSASVTQSASSADEDSNPKGSLTMVVKRQPMRRAGSDASTKLTLALRRMNENGDEGADADDPDSHDSPVVPPIMRRSQQGLTRTDSTVSMDSTGSGGDTNGSISRPVRTVVANAVAISEAQSDFDGDSPTGKKKGRARKPASILQRERNEKIAEGISGLDKLHECTLDGIARSVTDDSVPKGCVGERLSAFPPKGVIEHDELPTVMWSDGKGKRISHHMQVYLEKIRLQFMSILDNMQSDNFKLKVEAELSVEQKRHAELQKRKKQLEAQVETLTSDSLGLLKTRLGELGIPAKTPPEFIEKAKGIVSHHHELQRNKGNLEGEIRQLEADRENLVQIKEKELIEKLMRERPDLGQMHIRDMVNREIDRTLSGSFPESPSVTSSAPAKVSPLLNKLSDVTLTKCGAAGSAEMIRKRGREMPHKQRDWPEKRSKVGGGGDSAWAAPSYEERNGDGARTSAATLIISPSKQQQHVDLRKMEVVSPPSAQGPGLPGYYHAHAPGAGYYPQKGPATLKSVELPRVDLSMLGARESNVPPLILPPHPRPDSRSRSSEHTAEDTSYTKSKVSSTPRAEQFEDRLKTIIHSVLSADANGGSAPPSHQRQQPQQSQQQQLPQQQLPQALFIKREPPMHPPPNALSANPRVPSFAPGPGPLMSGHPSLKRPLSHDPPSSSRAMSDLIVAAEVERNLASGARRGSLEQPPRPSAASSSSSSSSGMLRMTQVIEDSIRGHLEAESSAPPAPASRAMEGLACPRTKSPDSVSALPLSRPNGRVEGLGARLSPFVEVKREPAAPFRDRYGRQIECDGATTSGSRPDRPDRPDPPLASPPVLPPKKQHLDDHPEYRMSKDEWQDAISTGFDRLVAYATEVDNRRKSSDSNSPSRSCGGPSGGGNDSPQYKTHSEPTHSSPDSSSGAPFDNSRASALSMKFKYMPK